MKDMPFINSPPVYIEITAGNLKALREGEGMEFPLERQPGGRLTQGCKEKLVARLQKFLDRKTWQPRIKVFCAIPANGVSLRRLSLPVSAKEDFQRLLLLQIENEFPIPPGELAWGWQPIEAGPAVPLKREVLIGAVKKEVLEDYAGVLSACGAAPVFTPATLARKLICPPQPNLFAMLEAGPHQTELATFDPRVPVAIRVLPAMSDSAFAEAVSKSLGPDWNGRKIFLSGADQDLADQLARRLGNDVACEALQIETGAGRSAAILGLKKSVEQTPGSPLLALQVKARKTGGAFNFSAPEVKIWAMRAVALLCVLLILPYAEAVLLKPFLARKLTKLQAEKVRLATIDEEMDFLQSLKQNQPPYLDALYTIAQSAPPGAKIDSLTMNRRGEVSLRGSMRTADQVTDFRSKLIGSGFFSTVAVEEQSPAPDRQKLNVRISAQWKPLEARAGLAIGPTAAEIENAKTNQTAPAGGAFFPGMMPPGAMPGPRPARR